MTRFEIGQPFLVIADPRTGGTFLTHCLSSHPDVYCYRKEPLHRRDVPRELLGDRASLSIVRLFVEQQGWGACGVKLVYKEFTRPIIHWAQTEGVKVIHLVRENAIRVALSRELNRRHREGEPVDYPNERTKPGAPRVVSVDAVKLVLKARQYAAAAQEMRDKLADTGLTVMPITYAEMIGHEGISTNRMERTTAHALCDFLGVSRRSLSCRLYPSASLPMRKILTNWPAVQVRIDNSELAYCLEDEDNWPGDDDGTDEELETDSGPEPDSESGSGESHHQGSGEPGLDQESPGDRYDLGPEPTPLAVP